jgi:hypothetical protein
MMRWVWVGCANATAAAIATTSHVPPKGLGYPASPVCHRFHVTSAA